MQRFLARVFHQDITQWVLKGGIGLLIRLPSARFSRDLDLSTAKSDWWARLPNLNGVHQLPAWTRSRFNC